MAATGKSKAMGKIRLLDLCCGHYFELGRFGVNVKII
jgi:hypothetical protein